MADVPANKVTGRFYIRVGGKLLPLAGDASIKGLGGLEREAVVGNEVHGFREKPVPAEVELTIADKGDVSVTELTAMTDVTITVETDRGKTFTFPNAWAASSGEESSNGEIKMTFNAAKCEEG